MVCHPPIYKNIFNLLVDFAGLEGFEIDSKNGILGQTSAYYFANL